MLDGGHVVTTRKYTLYCIPMHLYVSQALGISTALVNHIYSLDQARPNIGSSFSFLPPGFLVGALQLNIPVLSQNLRSAHSWHEFNGMYASQCTCTYMYIPKHQIFTYALWAEMPLNLNFLWAIATSGRDTQIHIQRSLSFWTKIWTHIMEAHPLYNKVVQQFESCAETRISVTTIYYCHVCALIAHSRQIIIIKLWRGKAPVWWQLRNASRAFMDYQ